MKKSFVLPLVFLFASGTFSFASDFYFSVSPFVTERYGQQDEFVYETNSAGETVKLSELNWDQHFVTFGGLSLSAGWKNLEVNASGSAALPYYCGTVYDSDWMNVIEDASPYYHVPTENTLNPEIAGIKTNYSESSCRLNKSFSFDIDAGCSFNVKDIISLKPFAGLEYSYSDFSSMGCTASYGNFDSTLQYYQSYDSDDTRSADYDSTEEVLRLERISYFTWAGLGISHEFQGFNFNLSAALCPYAYVQSIDSHYETGSYYLDVMDGFVRGFKTDAGISYTFNKLVSIHMKGHFEKINTLNGKSYSSSSRNGKYSLLSSTSGCSFMWSELSAGCTFSF